MKKLENILKNISIKIAENKTNETIRETGKKVRIRSSFQIGGPGYQGGLEPSIIDKIKKRVYKILEDYIPQKHLEYGRKNAYGGK